MSTTLPTLPREFDPDDPLGEGYGDTQSQVPPPQPYMGGPNNGAMPAQPMPAQPQMMPPAPGTASAPQQMSRPAHVAADELQRQIEAAKQSNPWGVHPSWWRTALAAAAQFGTRRNPALGQTIAGAITSSDPKVRLAQQTINNLKLQREAADEERAQGQLQQTSEYHNLLGGIRAQNAASMEQQRKLAERDKQTREGAEPLPTMPAAPVPPGLPPAVSSVLNAAPTPPPQPVRFANALPRTDPISGEQLQVPSKTDQETARLRTAQEVAQAGWKELPDNVADYFEQPRGTKFPMSEYTRMTMAYAKPDPAQTNAASKQKFDATMGKLSQAGIIGAEALEDPKKQWAGIEAGLRRGVITRDEATAAQGYMHGNTTPAQTEAAAIARMAALNAGRPVQSMTPGGEIRFDSAGHAISTNALGPGNIPGSTRATRQFAQTVTDQTPVVTQEVQELAGELGPAVGRWNDLWVNRSGMTDPKFAGLDQDLNMYATALVRVHYGMAGGEKVRDDLMKNFHEAQSPENLVARIQHADQWVKGYANMGNVPAVNPAAGPKTGGGAGGGNIPKLPSGNGKPIDAKTAILFYNAAGKDPDKARQMATQYGWQPARTQ